MSQDGFGGCRRTGSLTTDGEGKHFALPYQLNINDLNLFAEWLSLNVFFFLLNENPRFIDKVDI